MKIMLNHEQTKRFFDAIMPEVIELIKKEKLMKLKQEEQQENIDDQLIIPAQ
ncbi:MULTISPECIES: hypothetical protein [Brevibacillus]|uniref:Uncharacterized protein n=1 Tax=Brevibacillus laterosporus TaxID=1465 RepID=A0AAP3DLC6_BRELA|nr:MULTISPECIES: hypothetical protein [Brevibacillus]MCR8983330.1 hypothetical protein [Brevibacillus laterosporus]MCZ0810486.1 hypothetical protein [Brevibacillus laterosporus]MCZ0828240.1 hypothetical protein [Brevibacillus laterosporus]MCZ0853192.1 hypothetical protein [Brevibacillus laterosporus]MED1664518.1 hypothetical protein [Brevibacillus laterosporus]